MHQVNANDQPACATNRPFGSISGMHVVESEVIAVEVAQALVTVTPKLGIPNVFKASLDKANRSSAYSFRGPERGLQKSGSRSDTAVVRRPQAATLVRSGMAPCIAGLRIDSKTNPDEVLSDGPCALPPAMLERHGLQMKAVYQLVKFSLPLITG